jgi:Zn-dependent alcohol dehydrogenase
MRISAAVTESKGQAFAVRELELREPRPDEALEAAEAGTVVKAVLLMR